jgi:hypothetical protein
MQSAHQSLSTLTRESLSESQPMPVEWVERIFSRLTAQLGAKAADLWTGVPPETVKAEWSDALAGFHPTEIQRGLTSCQTRVFAPTLGEFLRLCRPGLDPELAWFEAVDGMHQRENGKEGEWTHPAVYRAGREFAYELRTRSFQEMRKRWEWLLCKEFRKGWGGEIPPSLARIAAEAKGKPPPVDVRERLASLRTEIAGNIAPVQTT